MPREQTRRTASALVTLATALGLGMGLAPLANAKGPDQSHPLQVTVEERDDQAIVRVRDPEGTLVMPKIASSYAGYMLNFEGEFVERDAHKLETWRLGRVQMAQYGDRAVVRLVQNSKRRGSLENHVQVTEVDGGLDIVVMDRLPPQNPAPVAAPTPEAAPTVEAAAPSTAETVAALQASLDPQAPQVPVADAPVEPGEIADADADAASAASDADATAPNDSTWSLAPDAAEDALAAPGLDEADAAQGPEDAAAGVPFDDALGDGDSSPPLGFAAWTLIPSILGLAGIGLWMRRRKHALGGAALDVVAKTSLGPKQQIVQVQIDGRELLLGVTEHQISLITELETTASVVASARTAPPGPVHAAARPPASPASAGPGPAHEFGVPAPVRRSREATGPIEAGRLDAFKARLQSALRREVAANGTDPSEAGASTAGAPANLDDLRRLLGRNASAAGHDGHADPAWAREDVA